MRTRSPTLTDSYRTLQVDRVFNLVLFDWDWMKLILNEPGRAGNDADMAATALFLAGPSGLFYNSAVLIPDGGEFYHRSSSSGGR